MKLGKEKKWNPICENVKDMQVGKGGTVLDTSEQA